jgi:YVTN family beta-propeller protein
MSIALNPAAGIGYAADTEHIVDGKNVNKTLSVIDLKTNTVKGKIEVGIGPFDMGTIDNKLFVSNSGDWTVSVVNMADNKVIDTIKVVDTPLGVAVDKGKKKVYVAIHGKGKVSVIDAKNDKEITTIDVGKTAWYIATDPAKNRAYVTIREENKLAVIDTDTDKVIERIDIGKEPIGVAVDPENNRLYVANHGDVSLAIMDTTNNKIVGTVKLSPSTDSTYSGSPWGVAID